MTENEIFIKIKADSDKALKEIDALTKQVKTMQGQVNKSAGDVNALTKSFTGLGNTLKGITAAFVSFEGAKSFVSTLSSLEQGMIGVAKTTGMTGTELQSLSDGLDAMSRELSGITITELQDIATTAGQLGIKGKNDILDFTEAVGKISVATDLTADQAAEAMAQLSNVLKEPITNTEKLGSVINELSNTTTATASDVVEFAQRVAGAGKSFGLTSAEIFGLSATLKDVGTSAELGGSAVSRVMGMMTSDVEGFAAATGKSMAEFKDLLTKDPIEALNLFLSKFGELDKFAQAELLKKLGIGGVETVSVLQKLAGAQDTLTKNLKTANVEYKTNTSLQKEYEIASKSLESAFSDVKDELLLLAKATGKELLPVIKDATNSTKKYIESLQGRDVQAFTDSIVLMAKGVGGLVEVLSKLNDIAAPDWLFGDNASMLGTVADGWARLGQNLKLITQDSTLLTEEMKKQGEAMAGVYVANFNLLEQGQSSAADVKARIDATQLLTQKISSQIAQLELQKIAEEEAGVSTANTSAAIETLREWLEQLNTQYAALNTVRAQVKADDVELLANADKKIAKNTELAESEKAMAEEQKKLFEELKQSQLEYWQAYLTNVEYILGKHIALERQLGAEVSAMESQRTAALNQRTQNEITASNMIAGLYKNEVLTYSEQNQIKEEISRLGRLAREATSRGEYEDAQKYYTAAGQLIETYGAKKEILFHKESSLAGEAQVMLDENRRSQSELSILQIESSNNSIEKKKEEISQTTKQKDLLQQLKDKTKEVYELIKNEKGTEFSLSTIKAIEELEELGKRAGVPIESSIVLNAILANKEIDALQQKASKQTKSTHIVTPDAKQVWNEMNKLKRNNTTSTHTIYVTKVYTNATGGSAFASGGLVGRYASGGMVSPWLNYLKSGGFPRRKGQIPGHDITGRDDVPSMLTRGEYVHRVAAVDYYGRDFMNAINQLRIPKPAHFAEGGVVSAKTVNVNLTMPDSKTTFSLQTDAEIAASLERYIRGRR